jgi:hypothetical protein
VSQTSVRIEDTSPDFGDSELLNAFSGVRTGWFIDPFGHRWAVDQRLRTAPHEEVVRIPAAMFGGGSRT